MVFTFPLITAKVGSRTGCMSVITPTLVLVWDSSLVEMKSLSKSKLDPDSMFQAATQALISEPTWQVKLACLCPLVMPHYSCIGSKPIVGKMRPVGVKVGSIMSALA